MAGADCALRFGVAVSGGPDSLALLLLCHGLKPGLVEAATVDHGLRAESATEAQGVADICARLGIAHRKIRVDVAEGNLQSQAREVRYAALGHWARAQGLVAIATAHHADDQAETMVMRLNRGSGLRGLAAIRPTRSIPDTGMLVFRPLLGWRKTELEALVSAAGLNPADDPSNRECRFDRARIRAGLAGCDWLDAAAMARSAAHLHEAGMALEWAIGAEWDREVAGNEDGGFSYTVTDVPRAIKLGVIERAIAFTGGRELRGGEIARLEERLRGGGKATYGGVIVEVAQGRWRFCPEPGRP